MGDEGSASESRRPRRERIERCASDARRATVRYSYYNMYHVDRNGPCMSLGSIILWIGKEEPSGGGVDGSRRLGGREDGGGERG